jgi:hypothetical protein
MRPEASIRCWKNPPHDVSTITTVHTLSFYFLHLSSQLTKRCDILTYKRKRNKLSKNMHLFTSTHSSKRLYSDYISTSPILLRVWFSSLTEFRVHFWKYELFQPFVGIGSSQGANLHRTARGRKSQRHVYLRFVLTVSSNTWLGIPSGFLPGKSLCTFLSSNMRYLQRF